MIAGVPVALTNVPHICSYYADGRNGSLPQFCDVKLLDSFITMATGFKHISETWAPGVDLWIGETASMFAGGAPHLSNSYVAGFM